MKKTVCSLLFPLVLSVALVSCASTDGRSSEKSGIIHVDVQIQSSDLMLSGYLEGPKAALADGESCPLVILMHGLMDWNEFDLIRKQADGYTDAGFAVLAVDFNGHGNSEGALVDMTISKEVADGEAILSFAKSLEFVSEVILVGHSQGGVVSSILAARHSGDIDSLVLLAPAGMVSDRFRAGICFGTEFDPASPPEKVQVFDGFVGKGYIQDAMALDLYGLAEGYSGHRVLVVAGGSDPLVSEEVARMYQGIYQNGNETSFVIIGDAPHDFYGMEEEVVSTVLSFLAGKRQR